ncbi:hypothetical protein MJO47_09880 [Desulfuromonas sp. KJ2020]|uniref:hypothetical protein n=1 Tax=Desulfuromonas sp. KJ2020 TaxID=2919173 RepID=UPI0020A7781C|nr:hypothetical protein [Desulfuromonas sp. KJ2020]MCP3177408.1 hypothetical protein [Desulfuromonas sp. KJ2020]
MILRSLPKISQILSREDETILAYLHGQKFQQIPSLRSQKPLLRGIFCRVLAFLYYLLKNCVSWRLDLNLEKVDYLVYAETSNQMDALASSLQELKHKNLKFVALGKVNLINNDFRKKFYNPQRFNFLDAVSALILVFLRGNRLRRKLLHQGDKVLVTCFFDHFCKSYLYLAYFIRVLEKYQPLFVIGSNDHSVSNRCLYAAANFLGIKTVYMQHASVNNNFPALRFDYAFLDGMASLECYQRCEVNPPARKPGFPLPLVFLSGQKKQLLKYVHGNSRPFVGLAINTLDPSGAVIELVNFLVAHGTKIKLRWHPRQQIDVVEKIKIQFRKSPCVSLSDPAMEDVAQFLSQCHSLIAGNTSIHLEAELMGVKTFYYELAKNTFSDVYGYVAGGLTEKVSDLSCLLNLIETNNTSSLRRPNAEVIRHYSASFNTCWEGREGELVVETLLRITKGEALESIFYKQIDSAGYSAIYCL